MEKTRDELIVQIAEHNVAVANAIHIAEKSLIVAREELESAEAALVILKRAMIEILKKNGEKNELA